MDLNFFEHILPKGRAWNLPIGSNIRALFLSFADYYAAQKSEAATVYSDLKPETTNTLTTWEKTFGLDRGLGDDVRRERLSGAWKALGGQSPKYIQDVLQNSGFDLYVHDFWVPGTEDDPIVRNPLIYVEYQYALEYVRIQCGMPNAQCGEEWAQLNGVYSGEGYPLVNDDKITLPIYFAACGEPLAQCEEPNALCGYYETFKDVRRRYYVPNKPELFPYFLYVGGETFPQTVEVPIDRKDELEKLILKVAPTHLWVIMLVKYV